MDVDDPQTPEGTPSGLIDIDNPETPEGAADAAEEVEGTYFKKDKQFTGKKLTGFDVEAGGEDAEYPKEIKVKVDSKSIGKSGKTLYLYKVDKSGNKLLETGAYRNRNNLQSPPRLHEIDQHEHEEKQT